MISFKHFLNEDSTSNLTPEEAARQVAKMCKPYLKMSGFKYDDGAITNGLYRGFTGTSDFITELSAPRARQPRNASITLHNILDRYLLDKFKYPYRSKGVFCVGSRAAAKSYGRVHLMFPIGSFKFAYSTGIEDAYADFEGSAGSLPVLHELILSDMSKEVDQMIDNHGEFTNVEGLLRAVRDYEKPDLWFKLVDKWLRKTNPYSDTNLKRAIKSGTEIMMQCDNYYLVSIYYPMRPQLSSDGKIFLETLMEEIK